MDEVEEAFKWDLPDEDGYGRLPDGSWGPKDKFWIPQPGTIEAAVRVLAAEVRRLRADKEVLTEAVERGRAALAGALAERDALKDHAKGLEKKIVEQHVDAGFDRGEYEAHNQDLIAENRRLREALESLRNCKTVDGMSANIRDTAKHDGRPNPIELADKALRESSGGGEER